MDQALSEDVAALLGDLRINVSIDNSESTLNGSLELILHIMECVNALRQVNEIIPPDQLDLTGGLFVKAQNEFSAAIGRILMFIMSTKPKPNLTELLQITVGKILNLFPESAAHDSYRNGTSLLHHAVSKAFADVRLIEVIHDANPICAGNPDNEGALPLHRAVANADISLEVVKFLIAVYPAGTSSADLEGYLPLHWAVNTDRPNIQVIEELIDAYPDACNTTCNMGSLPMHWAVDRPDPDMTVVYLLMKAYAKALRKGCSAGFLPIHRCVDRPNPSIACMKALIKKYPKSLEQDNCDGQLPLHRCVDRCDPSLEAVALLIQAYPGALDTPDVEGYVPLHIALDGESPCIPVVKLLIESCLESSTMKTQDGLLPLHYVLNCQDPSEELIELLLNSYPEGAEALAVDLYPEDPGADPLTWSGPWKKRKWTPLTRALELGNPVIVDMIRHAIETVHGDIGDGDRNRPVSTDSRRSKGAASSRPRSNHSMQQSSRPSSHNSHGVEDSTPLKVEQIPGTAVKKPPTSGVRGASTNNYVSEHGGEGEGGARHFSPAGESPAPREVEHAQPISSTIPTAVPPKQLFPAVGSASASVASQHKKKAESKEEALPEVSPRGAPVSNSQSEGSLLKAPVQQPEVEEEVAVKVSRHREKKDRESRTRHRERGDETDDGEKRKHRDRKERSRSRARPEGGDSAVEAEDGDKPRKHHRHHHRRHHRHHHTRHREGDEKDRERRRRPSKDREADSTPVRNPSISSGPGHMAERDENPPRYPKPSSGGGIAMNAEKEAEIAERLKRLELMEAEVKRKDEEAQEVARQAFLKVKEAEEALRVLQSAEADRRVASNQREGESKEQKADEKEDEEYPPYFNHAYSDRQNSHKFPTAATTNSSDPKYLDDDSPSPGDKDNADAILKSLEDFNSGEGTGVSHKFPPGNTYTLNAEGQ